MPDAVTLAACIAVARSIPGTAAAEAVQAANRAEEAAELAAQRSFAVTESGEEIIFTSMEGSGD